MDNRPIGVFDSGLGGLTAVRRLTEVLPHEDIIYLGDTSRVPYGSRSVSTIKKYATQDAAFLMSHNVKAVLIACGTVSTTALDDVASVCNVPVFGVVEPTCRAAASATLNGRIGLIATEASIRSGAYEPVIKQYRPDAYVFSKACPLFVPLVENGRINPGDIVTETVAREYLEPLIAEKIDTLVLGCTHYPLIAPIIKGIVGEGVALISSGSSIAEAVAEYLRSGDLLSDSIDEGEHSYFVTDRTDSFERMASMFLGSGIRGTVHQISLE